MRRNLLSKNQNGFVVLLGVLIIGAVALAMTTMLLTTGTDSQRNGLVVQQSTQARELASACAEEGLQQLQTLTSFTGTASVTLGAGSCTYTVTSVSSTVKTVDATGTVGMVIRMVQVYATIGATNISITSWQDIQ